MPLYLSIPAAALAGAVVSTLLIFPCLSLRGVYFAIVTLMYPLLFTRIIEAFNILGGTNGITGLDSFPGSNLENYSIILVLLVVLFGLRRFLNEDIGLVMRGVKDNDQSVRASGINVTRIKALAVFIASFIGCLGGAYLAHLYMWAGLSLFALDFSIIPIAAVTIGGGGILFGAVIGCLILVPLSEFLRFFGTFRIVLYCTVLTAFIVFKSEGIMAVLHAEIPAVRTVGRRMSILTVEGLEKTFGGLKALSGVSFSVKQGEIFGIIGPNGSGKTTLINCITGFIRPDEGKVLFKGKEITRWRAHKIARVGIARTFQVMRPFYSLPAYKNLIIPLWSPRARKEGGWRGGGKHGDRDTVAVDILEEIGFERDSRVPYKLASTLPTGYLKRLELARCLALRPEVIFCDEVFSGLSASEIASMLPLIEKLKMEGITLIMIEHRLRELFKVADRVMALQFGEKIAEGHYKDVIEDPRVKEAYLGNRGGIAMLEASGLMVYYENMLALNNVGIKAEEGSVIGVFGSNSAGKSTLMYMLSGIILDMRKKEEMRGGERITLLGEITLDGEEILPSAARARGARHNALPGAQAHLRGKLGHRKPADRLLPRSPEGPGRGHRICLPHLPAPEGPHPPPGRVPQRRGAADAGHRAGAHGAPEDPAARRAAARASAPPTRRS